MISPTEFSREYTAVRPSLIRMLRAKGLSLGDAEDFAQEAAASAWASREKYAAGTSFRAWLWIIARNAFYDHLRGLQTRERYKHRLRPESLIERPSAEDRVMIQETLAEIEQTLIPKTKAAILALALGSTRDEIDQLCGQKMRAMVSRTQRRLRKSLL